jgi:hypothetical protein
MAIEKCVGRIMILIYQDSKGIITKRRIRVDGKVRVFDIAKKAYRTLQLDGILAIQSVVQHVS